MCTLYAVASVNSGNDFIRQCKVLSFNPGDRSPRGTGTRCGRFWDNQQPDAWRHCYEKRLCGVLNWARISQGGWWDKAAGCGSHCFPYLLALRKTPLFLGVAKNKDVVTVLTSAEKRWNVGISDGRCSTVLWEWVVVMVGVDTTWKTSPYALCKLKMG